MALCHDALRVGFAGVDVIDSHERVVLPVELVVLVFGTRGKFSTRYTPSPAP